MPGTEPSSAFNQQVLRPIVTLAVPGAVAGGPWFLVVHELLYAETRGDQFFVPESLLILLFTLTILGSGMLVDGVGSLVEAFCFDRWRGKRAAEADHLPIWNRFLLLTYGGLEPVGHRYLRGLVQSLKFELNTATGLVLGTPAAVFLLWLVPNFARLTGTLAIASLLLASFLFAQAWATHGVLSQTRRHLVEHFEPLGDIGRERRPDE